MGSVENPVELSANETRAVLAAFDEAADRVDKVDRDHDGKLSPAELKRAKDHHGDDPFDGLAGDLLEHIIKYELDRKK